MKRRFWLILSAVMLLVMCSVPVTVSANDSFMDITGLYYDYNNPDFEFSVDGEKVSFGEIYSGVTVFVASYSDGRLVDAKVKALDAGDSYSDITHEEIGLDLTGADTVKAFLVLEANNPKPLCIDRSAVLDEAQLHDAYQLIYNDGDYVTGVVTSKDGTHESLDSGWVLDNRGGVPKMSIEEQISVVRDISTTEPVSLIKEVNLTSGERLLAEFACLSGGEGSYVGFCDEEGNAVYTLKNVGGEWAVLSKDGAYTSLVGVSTDKKDKFRIMLDQNTGKAETFINNVCCGETDLLSDNILNFRYAVDEESAAAITPGIINVVANYGVYESFDLFGIEEVYGWENETGAAVTNGELVLSGAAGAVKTFDEINTKYIAEMLAIFPEGENAGFKIMSGNVCAVEVASIDGALYANGKKVYESLTPNMWYRLRVEANPSDGTAYVVVNGREVGHVVLGSANPVGALKLFSESGNARFDDIKVYANPYRADYVSAPEAKADFSDYIVGINVCSLWRDNGKHFGWACVTPYDENRPVLGYYDEGNPETADWEIKYMVEHGIDVQAFCWYAGVNEGPIKMPRNAYQLHDGYQQAKYKDYMKYCIIWECSSVNFGSEQFRNHVVPYWFENYFLDENYFTLDNKIVIDMFGASNLIKETSFGSAENAAAEFEYLEQVAIEHGFSGIILIGNDDMGMLESIGADARTAYHWNSAGCDYEATKQMNIATNALSDIVYQIPTISCGYNDLAWVNAEGRSPLMTVEDFGKCFEWVKNEYLPSYAEDGTWQEKLVWLSTWNEYGEGTYIMPSGLNEFGYLDAVREHFTNLSSDHTDSVPTAEQAERINRLYPQYARYLRRQQSFEYQTIEPEYETVYTYVPAASNTKILKADNIVYDENGVTATSTESDFNVILTNLSEGVDISNIDAVRVIMETPAGSNTVVYFTTEEYTKQSAAKSASLVATSSEMTEYIYDFSSNSSWNGYLTLLRIDPANGTGITFTVKSVELLRNVTEDEYEKKKSESAKLYVNGILVDSYILPETNGDKVLFPFDPETSIHNRLHTFMTWNHDAKALALEADGHKAVFTVGSDMYVADGVHKSLGYTLYTTDGLPMLCYEALSEALGFEYSFDETQNRVDVVTDEYDMYQSIAEPVVGQWEFNTYDVEDWTTGTATISANGEYLTFDNTTTMNTDPAMQQKKRGIGFEISDFNTLEFRVRYKYQTEGKQKFAVYFMTTDDTEWSEAKAIRLDQYTSTESDGWETYTVNLADMISWTGKITGIRFDPFNTIGVMDIDYIRFYNS